MSDSELHGAPEWPPRPPALPELDALPEVPPFLPGGPVAAADVSNYPPPPRYQAPPLPPGAAPLRLDADLVKWPNEVAAPAPSSRVEPAADELWSPDVFGEDSGKVEKAGAISRPPRAPAAAPAFAPVAAPDVAPTWGGSDPAPRHTPAGVPEPVLAGASAPSLSPSLPVAAAASPTPSSPSPAPSVTPELPGAPSSPPVVTASVASAPAPSMKAKKPKKSRRKKADIEPPARVVPLSPPDVSEANKASIEMLRRQAVKTRKRNQRVARTIFAVFAVMMLAAGAGIVYLFMEGDKKESDGDPGVATTIAAAGEFGEDDAAAAAGGGLIPNAEAVGAIGAAQGAVDAVNGVGDASSAPAPAVVSLAELTADQVVPPLFVPLGQSLGASDDGLTRYVFHGPTLAAVDGRAFADWLALVGALPQSGDVAGSLAAGGLPSLKTGEIGVAIATEGASVTRLVVVSADGALTVDT